MATNDQILAEITALRKDVDSLTKMVRKVKTKVDDPSGEKAAARRNNPNNGFNRQRIISDTFLNFLGMGPGDTLCRADGTRKVFAYIRENNLKRPDNGKIIVPDDKLRTLLGTDEGVEVSFNTIQGYLSPHYLRAADEEPPVEAAPVEAASEPTTEPPATPKPEPVKKKAVVTKKKPVVRKPVVA